MNKNVIRMPIPMSAFERREWSYISRKDVLAAAEKEFYESIRDAKESWFDPDVIASCKAECNKDEIKFDLSEQIKEECLVFDDLTEEMQDDFIEIAEGEIGQDIALRETEYYDRPEL